MKKIRKNTKNKTNAELYYLRIARNCSKLNRKQIKFVKILKNYIKLQNFLKIEQFYKIMMKRSEIRKNSVKIVQNWKNIKFRLRNYGNCIGKTNLRKLLKI